MLYVLGSIVNKWKIAFFTSLIVSIFTVVFALLVVLDNGISYTYLEVSYNDQLKANEVLGNIIVRGGEQYTQSDFLHLLRQAYPDELIVEEGNSIKMGFNTFEFKDNKLVKVR
jgi:hypothetical protein